MLAKVNKLLVPWLISWMIHAQWGRHREYATKAVLKQMHVAGAVGKEQHCSHHKKNIQTICSHADICTLYAEI